MSTELKLRRGTNLQHTGFIGSNGEVTVNTSTKELHVHDGVTEGGHANLSRQNIAAHDSDVLVGGVAAKFVGDVTDAFEPLTKYTGYGVFPNVTSAINGGIVDCIAKKRQLLIDGEFTFSGQIVLKTFAKITGYGPDTSKLIYNGPDEQWAVTTEFDGVENVAQRINLSNFSLLGPVGTFTKKLFDCNGVRYSKVDNVSFLNCLTCMRLNLVWGDSFNNCSFKAGGDSGSVPAGSKGIDMVLGAVNAVSFKSCVVSFNEVAVDAGAAGRNVTFTDACTFESNKTVFRFIGAGSTKGFTVRDNYFEANENHHFYVDNGFGARDDQITIEENYFDITSGIQAGVVTIGQVGTGTSSLAVLNNHIEQLVDNSNPVNPYVIHLTQPSTNWNIQYESNHNFRVIGAGAVKIQHINWDNLDFRTFSSNIPYKPTYKINPAAPNNQFGPVNPSERLKIYVRNGMATMVGSVVDSGNVFAGTMDIVDIPFNLSSSSAEYPIVGHQRNGENINQILGLVKGTSISANFSASTTSPVHFSVSWPLKSGDYA